MALAGAMLLTLGACAPARHLTVRSESDFVPLAQPRLAVLPLGRAPSAVAPEGAEQVLTVELQAALARSRRFALLEPAGVADAALQMGASGSPPDGTRIGAALGADLATVGLVDRYVDRIGGALGIETPASLRFTLDLVECRSGRVLWHGEYAQIQEPLLYDLSQLGTFLGRGMRWITVAELAAEAMQETRDALEEAYFEKTRSGSPSVKLSASATAE